MRLSEQQIRFFDVYGYLAFPRLMADRIEAITAEFEALWAARGGGHDGKPHDHQRRSCLAQFIDQSEYLSSLLDDPRIVGIAESLLGEDFNYMGSDGNYYVGDTGWHSDGRHLFGRHVKIGFYLDPLTRETGCLRIIPGSHRPGDRYSDQLHEEVSRSEALWGVPGGDLPAVALETQPGDLICFDHNLKHAAFGGGTRRRMFTMNLCRRYAEERLEELRQYISGGARFWVEEKYGAAMLRTAGPERMRHLEQPMAAAPDLRELSRQARTRMAEPSRG